jgi:hypothetical protein
MLVIDRQPRGRVSAIPAAMVLLSSGLFGAAAITAQRATGSGDMVIMVYAAVVTVPVFVAGFIWTLREIWTRRPFHRGTAGWLMCLVTMALSAVMLYFGTAELVSAFVRDAVGPPLLLNRATIICFGVAGVVVTGRALIGSATSGGPGEGNTAPSVDSER